VSSIYIAHQIVEKNGTDYKKTEKEDVLNIMPNDLI
jgi:hypothetical protein